METLLGQPVLALNRLWQAVDTRQYCGEALDRSNLKLDHVLPRHRGGLTTWENIVCPCTPCNTRKGNHLLHEASMRLIHKPKCPKCCPSVTLSVPNHLHENWKRFLDIACRNVELGDSTTP